MKTTTWNTCLSFCLCIFATTICSAATPTAYEVKDFEVSGVKLGMTTAQAVDAVITKYKIDKSQIYFDKPLPGFPNAVTNKPESGYFYVDIDSTKRVQVDLVAKIPPDKLNPMIVVKVNYRMPDTPANKKMMQAAAFEKYGEPTDKSLGLMTWCTKPAQHGYGCLQINGQQQGFELGLGGTQLDLRDGTYRKKYDDHVDKLKSSKPTF
jgi:hypothetical protein